MAYWHLISRDERRCITLQVSYSETRAEAVRRDWLILDLGWCPRCRFCSLGGGESDLSDRTGFPPKAVAQR